MNALLTLRKLYDGGHIRALLALSITGNLLLLAPSFHMLQVYDRVLNSSSAATLFYLSIIAIAALVAYGVMEAARGRIAQRLAAAYTVAVARKLFARFLTLPPNAGSPSQYLRDYGQVRNFIGGRGFVALFDLPFMPLYLVLMFLVHWSLGVLTLLGMIGLIAIAIANSTFSEEPRQAAQRAEEEAFGFAQMAFARVEDVRAFGLLPRFISIWGKRTATALQATEEGAGVAAGYYSFARSFRQILQILIMAWAAWLVLNASMSAGLIVFATMISAKALAPIEQITGGWDQLAKARMAFQGIEEIIGPDRSLAMRPELPEPQGVLQANRIFFRPPQAEKPVIAALSLTINPGELVVISGAAAAGKSALLRMLAGAIPPDHGEILLDGAERSLWPIGQWGKAIGYLAQDISLFPGSIADNIARFDPEMDMEAVYDASRCAGAHEAILAIPNGYLSVVGEGRTHLSASQKQRIALARAFYGSPRVLVLDQPNALLDPMSEGVLMNSIAAAKARGTTIVVSSHRAAMMSIATRAYYLRDGQLEPMQIETGRQPGMRSGQPVTSPPSASENAPPAELAS